MPSEPVTKSPLTLAIEKCAPSSFVVVPVRCLTIRIAPVSCLSRNVHVIWLSGLASMPLIVSPLSVPLELPLPEAPVQDGAGVSIAQPAGTSSLTL